MLVQVNPARAQIKFDPALYAFPDERSITLQQLLRYKGEIYQIHYYTTGDYDNVHSSFLTILESPEQIERNKITGLLITKGDQIVQDENVQNKILSLYRAGSYLYEIQPPGPLGYIDDEFVNEMRKLSTITQFVTLSFQSRQAGTAEAIRGIFTPQIETPEELQQFNQDVLGSLRVGKTVLDAVDWELENTRYSNIRSVRVVGKDIRETFSSYHLVSDRTAKNVLIANRLINPSCYLNR
jgi:hypothetical protein